MGGRSTTQVGHVLRTARDTRELMKYLSLAMERRGLWSTVRHASPFGRFVDLVTPISHRGLVQTSWGPMPQGLSDENRRLHIRRLRTLFLVFLRDECAHPGERALAEVLRRHPAPPRHLSLDQLVRLERSLDWFAIVEAAEGRPFDEVVIPDVDRMNLPAITFPSPTSALERLMWLGLDPEHRSVNPVRPVRAGSRPVMARDRRERRLQDRREPSDSRLEGDSDRQTCGVVVPFRRPRG